MAILMIGYGANRMKFPVTAFDDLETGREVINSLDIDIEWNSETEFEVEGSWKGSKSRELAESFWDGSYFMGDAPFRYELLETNNEVGIFYMSND